MKIDEQDILSFWQSLLDFNTIYELSKKSLPFHINLIDELHANENAHTRILMRILGYSKDGQYKILKSFLSMLPTSDHVFTEEVISPKIDCNVEYIDGLIEEASKYAVIVENKIHGAVDQESQIERYINTVMGHGISNKHLYLLYLTNDGSKYVSDFSLTGQAKELLDYNNPSSTGRFLALNYKENVLPWLENEVLPNCLIKEDWLVSALTQYIDHLKGRFQLRKENDSMNQKLREFVNKQVLDDKSEISSFDKISQSLEMLDQFRLTLESLRDEHYSKYCTLIARAVVADISPDQQYSSAFKQYRVANLGTHSPILIEIHLIENCIRVGIAAPKRQFDRAHKLIKGRLSQTQDFESYSYISNSFWTGGYFDATPKNSLDFLGFSRNQKLSESDVELCRKARRLVLQYAEVVKQIEESSPEVIPNDFG